MTKYTIIFLLLISCSKNKHNKVKLTSEIKCFSTFIMGSRSDTIRRFVVSSYMFNKDSLTILKLGKGYKWKVEKTLLTQNEILTINTLAKKINFKSYLGNNIHEQMRTERTMYCGPSYGFVDSIGNVEVFVPFGNEKLMNTLVTILYYKKTYYTNDTTEIINYTNDIKRKYLKVSPPVPMERVEFVPPIIKEDQIEK